MRLSYLSEGANPRLVVIVLFAQFRFDSVPPCDPNIHDTLSYALTCRTLVKQFTLFPQGGVSLLRMDFYILFGTFCRFGIYSIATSFIVLPLHIQLGLVIERIKTYASAFSKPKFFLAPLLMKSSLLGERPSLKTQPINHSSSRNFARKFVFKFTYFTNVTRLK